MTVRFVFDSAHEQGIQFMPQDLASPPRFLPLVETAKCEKMRNRAADALLLGESPNEGFIIGIKLFVNNRASLPVRDLIVFGEGFESEKFQN